MVRILSYNILCGGTGRVNALARMIKAAEPDVVGLVEAADSQVVEELAERAGMQYCINIPAEYPQDQRPVVLSRLPIVGSQLYERPGILNEPLLEVCVEQADGQQFTIFVTHLAAAFNQGWAGNHIQQREVREILSIMAAKRGIPHLLIGDFNTLAPGDAFKGSLFLHYMLKLDAQYKQNTAATKGYTYLDIVVPPQLRIFYPLLRIIPGSELLSTVFDVAASLYVPRGSIRLLGNAGYVDCFRLMNLNDWGFTYPAAAPAGRIDFIFASPELAARLATCRIITSGEGLPGEQASDHLPVCAEFCEIASRQGAEE